MDEDAARRAPVERPPVYGAPRTWSEGEGWDPNTATVGWDLSFDAKLTFGRVAGGLQVTLNVTGDALRDGVLARTVTSAQVEAYALQLLGLARGEVGSQVGEEVRRG